MYVLRKKLDKTTYGKIACGVASSFIRKEDDGIICLIIQSEYGVIEAYQIISAAPASSQSKMRTYLNTYLGR